MSEPTAHSGLPEPTFPRAAVGEPVWELALLHPPQGRWTHEDYLVLTDHTNTLIEYTEGRIEFLKMPTIEHQLIVRYLLNVLSIFVEPKRLGVVLFCGTRVYVEPDRYREPDIVFNFAENHAKSGKRFYNSADLVMEVVSDDEASRKRDLETKRLEYAAGGIPEYWIVDPQQNQVTVLTLDGGAYAVHGEFRSGDEAASKLLDGFQIDVDSIFAAADA